MKQRLQCAREAATRLREPRLLLEGQVPQHVWRGRGEGGVDLGDVKVAGELGVVAFAERWQHLREARSTCSGMRKGVGL